MSTVLKIKPKRAIKPTSNSFSSMAQDRTVFLVIVDYYSKFTIINRVPSKAASSVIVALKNVFVLCGLHQEIFTVNDLHLIVISSKDCKSVLH